MENKRIAGGAVCLAFVAGAVFAACGDMLDVQNLVDAAAARGGGTVRIDAGEHVAKPFALKSNVTLELAEGATLLASTNIADYAAALNDRCFILAENATNVAIVGKGAINGRGAVFKETKKLRGESQPQSLPLLMRFSRCRNVRLEGFRYTNPGSWACHLRNCDGVKVKGISCFNYCNKTNDGLDIESCNVTVEDCDFSADDDALCFKAESDKSFPVTNVVVRNCRMASACNGIKFGTGSYNAFRDILIENCTVRRTKESWRFNWPKSLPFAGITNRLCGIAGLALEVVDGGRMENVTIRNVTIEGYMTPIFIRHHHRHEPKGEVDTYLRNVLIENVRATAESRIACSITGVPAKDGKSARRPRDITLRNVSITVPGGGTAADAKGDVPERDGAYPEAFMFRRNLPAHGFYVRHADNIRFENVEVKTVSPDARPKFVVDDCTGVVLPDAERARDKIAKLCKIVKEDVWYGHRRTVFKFKGRDAWVVEPSVPAREGKPWTWTMQWATAFVDRTGVPDLLRKGFHHVTLELFSTRMDDSGVAAAAEFQKFLVEKLGFAPKANLVGMSWGGFFSIRYAAAHPANVRRIYLDAPLLCFTGFKAAASKRGIGSWFDAQPPGGDWRKDPRMPVNMAGAVAKAGIPVLLLYGGKDNVVPPAENCLRFIEDFKAGGGSIDVRPRPSFGHHPHGMGRDELSAITDFFMK